MDAIAHIALPIHVSDGREPSAFIDPVVQCMRTILASALLHRARIRRVFITSSAAALRGADPEGRTSTTLDEGSWNNFSVQYCEEKGAAAEPLHKYRAGKVLAERAAWAFWETHKAEVGWDLVVLHPSYVFGPSVLHVEKPEKLAASMRVFYDAIFGGAYDHETLATFGSVGLELHSSCTRLIDVHGLHSIGILILL